jgi:hypothetical protein
MNCVSFSSNNTNYNLSTSGEASPGFQKTLKNLSHDELAQMLKDPSLNARERTSVLNELAARAYTTMGNDGGADGKDGQNELQNLMGKLRNGDISEDEMNRLAQLFGLTPEDMDKPVPHGHSGPEGGGGQPPKLNEGGGHEPEHEPEHESRHCKGGPKDDGGGPPVHDDETPKENGSNSSPNDGKSPAPSDGKSPAPADGKSPAPADGKTPAPADGKTQTPDNTSADQTPETQTAKKMGENQLVNGLNDPNASSKQKDAYANELLDRRIGAAQQAHNDALVGKLLTLKDKLAAGALNDEDRRTLHATQFEANGDHGAVPEHGGLPPAGAERDAKLKELTYSQLQYKMWGDKTLNDEERRAVLGEMAKKANDPEVNALMGKYNQYGDLNQDERKQLENKLALGEGNLPLPVFEPLPADSKEMLKRVDSMSDNQLRSALQNGTMTNPQRTAVVNEIVERAKANPNLSGEDRKSLLDVSHLLTHGFHMNAAQKAELERLLGVPADWLHAK